MSVQIADDDAGSAILEVTIDVDFGAITLPTGSVTVLSGASGTSSITFEGTVANINTALNSLTYTPTSDFVGLGEVQVTVDDRGNTGAGGAQTATESLYIDVTNTNDSPSIVQLRDDAVAAYDFENGTDSIASGGPAITVNPPVTLSMHQRATRRVTPGCCSHRETSIVQPIRSALEPSPESHPAMNSRSALTFDSTPVRETATGNAFSISVDQTPTTT